MEKRCINCIFCEDLSNTITKEFAGFCKLKKSYIHWTYCTEYVAKNTDAKPNEDQDDGR